CSPRLSWRARSYGKCGPRGASTSANETWPSKSCETWRISMTHNLPHVRASKFCCCCGHEKPKGLLVCWPCNAALKKTHDGTYGVLMDDTLDSYEEALHDARNAEYVE